ncbi:hypothetical protein VNO78_34263 [Psophocarpus tetragonolobus]|uniref:Uncharacterized protein n=1 Tax=Psophocarpus tetragonolobus TaxID=3891 RepID=A0AAN9RKB9_PSOTE
MRGAIKEERDDDMIGVKRSQQKTGQNAPHDSLMSNVQCPMPWPPTTSTINLNNYDHTKHFPLLSQTNPLLYCYYSSLSPLLLLLKLIIFINLTCLASVFVLRSCFS